jgi:hypothetical protein
MVFYSGLAAPFTTPTPSLSIFVHSCKNRMLLAGAKYKWYIVQRKALPSRSQSGQKYNSGLKKRVELNGEDPVAKSLAL